MDSATRDLITWTLGVLGTLGLIISGAVRYMLLPYLREHLLDPVREVQKQVTEDHHNDDREQPTVLDRIDDVGKQVLALARVIDSHLEWSDRWTDLIEREIELVKEGDQLTRDKLDAHKEETKNEGEKA